MTEDVIGIEHAPSRRVWLLLVVVAVVVVGAVALNSVQQARETSGLRACVSRSEGDLADLSRRAAGVETYASPQLDDPSVPAAVRANLASLVEASVAHDLPRSRADRGRCTGMTVLPWHSRTSRARDDYASYLTLRLAQLGRATHDLRQLHLVDQRVARARATARRSLASEGVTLPA